MQLDSLIPGSPLLPEQEILIEWHDRTICSMLVVRPQVILLKAVIGWDFQKSRGISLYFPAEYTLFESVKSKLNKSWDATVSLVREFVSDYRGVVAVSLEDDAGIIEVRRASWPLLDCPNTEVCNIDATMNNMDIRYWEKFIMNNL